MNVNEEGIGDVYFNFLHPYEMEALFSSLLLVLQV